MKPTTTILTDAANCFKSARQNLIAGAELLHKILREKLYEAEYSTFAAYCEDACQIHPTQASRLIKVYEYYCIKNSFSMLKLQETDPEKLYLALGTKGTAEEQAERAQLLTRSEIRAQLGEDKFPDCKHPETYTLLICKDCGARL